MEQAAVKGTHRRNKTPEKEIGHHVWREAFIASLKLHGSPTIAAEEAGIHRSRAYAVRAEDEEFRQQWEDALEQAADRLEAEVFRRAFEGCERPVFHQGKECGRIREFSDTLAMFWLKGARPGKYREGQQHINVSASASASIAITEQQRTDLIARRQAALTGQN